MIRLTDLSLSQVILHAESIFPDECCGFLFGHEANDGERTINQVTEVDNAKNGDKKRRFEISAKDYMRAEQYAATNDLSLLGVYHSHPNHPAIPSEHDRVAALPFFSYIIISVMQGKANQIRSWRLNDHAQFEEEIFSSLHINQSI